METEEEQGHAEHIKNISAKLDKLHKDSSWYNPSSEEDEESFRLGINKDPKPARMESVVTKGNYSKDNRSEGVNTETHPPHTQELDILAHLLPGKTKVVGVGQGVLDLRDD